MTRFAANVSNPSYKQQRLNTWPTFEHAVSFELFKGYTDGFLNCNVGSIWKSAEKLLALLRRLVRVGNEFVVQPLRDVVWLVSRLN